MKRGCAIGVLLGIQLGQGKACKQEEHREQDECFGLAIDGMDTGPEEHQGAEDQREGHEVG